MTTRMPAVEVEGLRWEPSWISEMGCLRPALKHLGREVSWCWLQGATGYAFLLNIHNELCPSGWHVAEVPVAELGRNLGVQIMRFTPEGHEFPADADMPRRQGEVWEATRTAIGRGQPCYGYNLEIGDYYVVYGYDDVGYYYSGPRCEAGKGPLPWQDYGPRGQVPGLLCMGAVGLSDPANDVKTVHDALAFAVEHARTPSKPDDVYRAGLPGYDQWVAALKSGKASEWGAAYNAACYLECREAAVGFLKEAKERLGDAHAELFDEAIEHYQGVVKALREVAEAFPTEGHRPEHVKDESRVQKATEALKAAQTAEARGVSVLERLVAVLESDAAGGPADADTPAAAEGAGATGEAPKEDQAAHSTAAFHGYGFRYDPMTFVEKSTSLQAALVRTFVLEQPKDGDRSIIRARIDEILAAQTEEGALSDHPLHAVTQTGGKIREAIELGAAPDDPRIRRAVEYVARHEGVDEKGDALGIGMARTLRLVEAADGSAVRDAVRRQIARAEDWIHPWSGCPWTPAGQLKELWEVRDVGEGVDDVITRGLQGIAPKLNEAGCLDFNDPWGYLDVAGTVDHPLGRQIAEKQIPMILRSQEKDGGWGEHSLIVFRALVKYDLLAPLRQRPPLPPDWEVVRSVPAPDGDLSSLAWDGARLWVCDRQANEAIAVSPDDGKVVRRLKIPGEHVRAVGWWDGALAVTQQLPTERGWTSEEETRRLLRVNPETGQVERNIALQHMNNIWGVVQVDGRLIVADGFINAVGIFDAAALGEPRIRTLGAPGTIQLAAQDGTLWHSDWLLTEIIFRSDLEGRLLDWGTKPFDGDLEGLAWDGEHLWALDSVARRIHVIERTAVPGPA